MGQKVNPIIFRLRSKLSWFSRWHAIGASYKNNVIEDIRIRNLLKDSFKGLSISKILIERHTKAHRVIVRTTKSGNILSKKGEEVNDIKNKLKKLVGSSIDLIVEGIVETDLDALLIAQGIAQQLEKRISFKKAIKRPINNALKQGALGIKILCSGRLNGAEIARKEWHKEGKVPLHTIKASIDYAASTAFTTFGTIGIKVWVYRSSIHQTVDVTT